MKLIHTLIACLLVLGVFAQKFKTSTSEVHFFSSAPLENIEAKSSEATSIIDAATNNIAIVIPMTSFEFEKALMEEHFNENYVESDKYPNATFKGTITSWDQSLASDSATAIGELTVHGVSKEVTIKGLISRSGEGLTVNAVFPIALKDHKIKIPKIVWQNIAEEVEVTATFDYLPYE